MKRYLIYFLILVALGASAQTKDIDQIISQVFYHDKVYEKIFFEYAGLPGQDSATFLQGHEKGMKCTFIVGDKSLRDHIPNLFESIGLSHATEKFAMTISFLSKPNGKIFITHHILDPAILLFIDFDRILIERKRANVEFHTTSLTQTKGELMQHYRVNSALVKRKGRWKIRKMKVEAIDLIPMW